MRSRFGTEDATISGLRTRYFPRKRIGHGLISVAPWINLMLLIAMFVLLEKRFVIQPGYVFRMPAAPLAEGVHPDWRLVVMSMPQRDGTLDVLVFFNDERFRLSRAGRVEALSAQLAGCKRTNPAGMLMIEADERVPHGALAQIMEMVHAVGLRRVGVAVCSRQNEGEATP